MKLRHPGLIRQLSRAIAIGGRALFSTVRVEIVTATPGVSPYDPQATRPHVYCIWHDGIAAVLFSGRCCKMTGLTSRHADGGIVSGVMTSLGIASVRGSSQHGGATALRQLMEVASRNDIAITTDGPRGPRRRVKDGLIYLASQTGLPIVPVTFSAGSAWRPRGRWTDMVFPHPFTRAWLMAGVPVSVPTGISRGDVARYRQFLQKIMDRQQSFCDALAARQRCVAPYGFEDGCYWRHGLTRTPWQRLGMHQVEPGASSGHCPQKPYRSLDDVLDDSELRRAA